MAGGEPKVVLREIDRIFRGESVAGLSDAQLLERFAARGDDEAGASAFEALIGRHAPLVLGVCRRTLRHPSDVEDAFQATFLVLVRKSGSIRVDDSLAPWLYGVARRVAARSRVEAARRRARERPELAEEPAAPEADRDDVGPALLEEVDRLPERFRRPVVLCYLDGLTHDQAAGRLRCPVGTVRSRLDWARRRLRSRLTRRGLAPSAALLASTLRPGSVRASVPAALSAAATRAALQFATDRAAKAGVVSATAAALAKGVLTTMTLARWIKAALLALAATGLLASGAAALAWATGAGPEPPAPGRKPDSMPPMPDPDAKAAAPIAKGADRTTDSDDRGEVLVRAQTDLEVLRMDVEALRKVLHSNLERLIRQDPSPFLQSGPQVYDYIEDRRAIQDSTRQQYVALRQRLRREQRRVADLLRGRSEIVDKNAAGDEPSSAKVGDRIEQEEVDMELEALKALALKSRLQTELAALRGAEFQLGA